MKSFRDVMSGMGSAPSPRGAKDIYAGGYMTKHGFFRADEIGRENYDSNGEMFVQFPISVHPHQGPQYRDIPVHVVNGHESGFDWGNNE